MNTLRKYLFLFVLLASLLTACAAPAPTAANPVTIAQGFWDAVNAKNIDAAMTFVADDIVTNGFPSHFTNKADFSAFLLSGAKKGTTYEITDLKLDSEDKVTFTIRIPLKGSNNEVLNGPAILQVKDGKIIYIEIK